MERISATHAIELARQLGQEFAKRADQADVQGKLPTEDVEALKSSGYLTLNLPTEYGGQGLSMHDCLAAHLELARGSGASAMVAGMPMQVFGHAREVKQWSADTFEWFCRAVVEEGALFNSVASEPQLGSPSRGGLPDTHADPHPHGWRVNGHKTWTTGGRHLTHMLVRVRVEDAPGVVLVLGDTPGVRWEETWSNSLSLRASDSHDLFLEDVIVPSHHLVERGQPKGPPPPPNAWFPMVMATLYLGIALAARDRVIRFALERVPTALGKPIATLPKIQRQIGEIDLQLQAAKALLFKTAAEWVGDDAHRSRQMPQIVAAKHLVAEMANEVTEKALRVAGGQGITKALPLERHFRDVRAGLMQPPSGDTALEIIGRHAIDQLKPSA